MRYLALATLAAAATLVGAPAFAQSVLEEVTVTVHGLQNEEQTKSQAVSFADLDLTKKADRQKLGLRVADTAHDLCEAMNEPGPRSPDNFGHSCEEIAVRNAKVDIKQAVAAARGADYAQTAFADPEWNVASADANAASTSATEASATEPATATLTIETVTNGPIPDTAENRARYGQPLSNAGKHTAPAGN